ncbi:MAG: glutathione S-transferase [Hyphomicrobiales bacterium]|nr:glutathione S-transferase [Hyphomicrobiales bacterium]
MILFGHPFSSYTWKALIAFHEIGASFEFRNVDPSEPENGAELRRRWPIAKFPLLVDGDLQVMEATSIIEHLDATQPGSKRLIPAEPAAARDVRMLDRILDNYVMNVMQEIVNDRLRPDERKDPAAVLMARAKLDTIYAWLDQRMASCEWASGDDFSMADCAAAPSLFYADWVHPNGGRFPVLAHYRKRLLARPSVAKAVDGGRPYRHYFPGGAPDRD